MDKREFINKLRFHLRGYFSKKETADIISDYEDFFVSGGNEKTEQQICLELGDPGVIAAELKEEFNKKKKITVTSRTVMRLAALLPLTAIAVFIYAGQDIGWDIYKWCCAAGVVIFVVILRFILDSGGLFLNISKKIPYKPGKVSLLFDYVILTFIPIVFFLFLNAALQNTSSISIFVKPESYGSFFENFSVLCSVITIIIIFKSFIGYYRNQMSFSVIYFGLSTLMYLNVAMKPLYFMSNGISATETTLLNTFVDALAVYGFALVLSGLASILITVTMTYLKKREEY